MQQGRGVDEFDYGGHVEALLPLEPQGAAAQEQEDRAQALASRGNDVMCDAANQWHARIKSACDDLIDLEHILFDDGKPG